MDLAELELILLLFCCPSASKKKKKKNIQNNTNPLQKRFPEAPSGRTRMALALRSWGCWVRQHGCAWSQWGQSKQPQAPARGPRAARLLRGRPPWGWPPRGQPGVRAGDCTGGAGDWSRQQKPPSRAGSGRFGGLHPPCIPAAMQLPFSPPCVRYGTCTNNRGKSPRCQPRCYLSAALKITLGKG